MKKYEEISIDDQLNNDFETAKSKTIPPFLANRKWVWSSGPGHIDVGNGFKELNSNQSKNVSELFQNMKNILKEEVFSANKEDKELIFTVLEKCQSCLTDIF